MMAIIVLEIVMVMTLIMTSQVPTTHSQETSEVRRGTCLDHDHLGGDGDRDHDGRS